MKMMKIGMISCFALLAVAAIVSVPKRGNAEQIAQPVEQTAQPDRQATGGKVLVAYFTCPTPQDTDASSGSSLLVTQGRQYGNTEYVARTIAEYTRGDLFAIETSRRYPARYEALIDEAKKEAEENRRPPLTSHIENPDDYDVIFVGYPNWWYDMPMVLYSFFEEYDFDGKTVIPFVTHGGSRFSQSVETIAGLEKNARVVRGPAIAGQDVPASRQSIRNWLEREGLLAD